MLPGRLEYMRQLPLNKNGKIDRHGTGEKKYREDRRIEKRTGILCQEEEKMREELMKILNELRPEVDFEKEKALIDDGVLDSFDIVALVGDLNDTFDVNINIEDLLPENFNSADAMIELITKLQGEE